jgi:glycerophosphoryl diester phosphodiesterase
MTKLYMTSLIDSARPVVLAHRGDSRVAPENTRPAFESALRLGVDLVELDYHESADGVPVVFHDEELDRCTDACARWGGQKVPLASRAWSDLCQLDAGRWFGDSFGGTRLMRLEDALRLICPRAGCMIERKGGDAATLVNLIERLGYVDRCVITAFDWPFLARCHSLSARMLLGALGTETLTERHLAEAKQMGARVIGWDNDFVTAEHVELVHAHHLQAWVWTVDDASRAAELIAWGVDGLISNVPGVMLEVVAGSNAG